MPEAQDRLSSELDIAIEAVGGSQSALAMAIGVRQPTISEWARGERAIPEARCPDIERVSDGKASCERLRTDIAWHRIADKSWPWHPKGRPVVDLTKSAREAA